MPPYRRGGSSATGLGLNGRTAVLGGHTDRSGGRPVPWSAYLRPSPRPSSPELLRLDDDGSRAPTTNARTAGTIVGIASGATSAALEAEAVVLSPWPLTKGTVLKIGSDD